ncbi:MAG: glutamate-5-semialdehyde dehydrogenase, partial [Candidatus Hadarchaeum sp.]
RGKGRGENFGRRGNRYLVSSGEMKMSEVLEKAAAARKAALKLATVTTEVKNSTLLKIASAILENKEALLKANAEDLKAAEGLLKRGRISLPLLQRLKLSEDKLQDIAKMVRSVAELEDPVGRTLYAVELDRGLELYKVSCPIGVIGAIFEARPDVLPQISALCLKSGNAVVLKGGSEARRSNEAFFNVIKAASESAGIPPGWIQLIEARSEVRELLRLDEYIDLLVPRGSKEFVKFIQTNTNIPVLGHAEGLCHIYVDADANIEKALKVCYDAKVQYPAVCNAVETILVHTRIAERFLKPLEKLYAEAGVEIRGDERVRKILPEAKRATEKDWRTEYLDLIVSIKVVDSIQEAIDHINTYGSKHTDAIVTENGRNARLFLTGVDSSSVMLNASTRFSDGYRYGLGAEVGISTGKIHARGPVGLEGLTTSKYYLLGDGHVVADYLGPKAKPFTHLPLKKRWSEIEREL